MSESESDFFLTLCKISINLEKEAEINKKKEEAKLKAKSRIPALSKLQQILYDAGIKENVFSICQKCKSLFEN